MTTTIQIEEESAIIPLKRLNEMKDNERIFRSDEKFLKAECKGAWYEDDVHRTYFVSSEHEVARVFEQKIREERERYESLSRENSSLRKDKQNLESEITKLKEKKWYEFIPKKV